MKEQETKTLGGKRRQVVFVGGKVQGSSALRALVQYTLRDKPNKVVKCPDHTENMREKETKSVSGKIDKERRRKKNT